MVNTSLHERVMILALANLIIVICMYTVKPLLTTTLRSDQTPYNDHTTCPRFTLL